MRYHKTVYCLIAVMTSVRAAMGPYFSTGAVATNSFIREAISTLILPDIPSGASSDAVTSLWVGMGTSNGDLIQSIADNWQSGTWSLYAYTLKKTSDTSQQPIYGTGSAAAASGQEVTMHYKYDDSTGNYTQYLLLNGKQVSTLSTSDGKAQGFGSSVECALTNCGTVGAHKWINTTITLDVADENYGRTLALANGVSGTLRTSDGGKTWKSSLFSIPSFTFS